MRSKEEFIAYKPKKEKRQQKNKKTESREKSKIKKQWNKIKEKMDDLVKLIDAMDLERIQGHAQESDRLCNVRNIELIKPRKDVKKS